MQHTPSFAQKIPDTLYHTKQDMSTKFAGLFLEIETFLGIRAKNRVTNMGFYGKIVKF
jgi:hypothetical protein